MLQTSEVCKTLEASLGNLIFLTVRTYAIEPTNSHIVGQASIPDKVCALDMEAQATHVRMSYPISEGWAVKAAEF